MFAQRTRRHHRSARPALAKTLARGPVPAALIAALAAVAALMGCQNRAGGEAVETIAQPPPVAPAPRPRDAALDAATPDATAPTATRPDVPVCTEAVCCVGPQCPKRAPGLPCQTSDQCETGFCADGVCCNVGCTGACVSCNQADRMGECLPVSAGDPDPHLLCRQDAPESCGQTGVCNGMGGCAKFPSGTPCGDTRCQSPSAMLPVSECDGEGMCLAGAAVECAPFLCEGRGCRVTCTEDRQCQAPHVCVNGSCGKRGRGQNCSEAEQCESGFCVEGVCCESACAGRCMTCASSKGRGRCLAVPAGGADPKAGAGAGGSCVDQGAESCGTTGRCDGKGGCETYRNGTSCGSGVCDPASNTGTAASVCKNGRCERAEPRSCAPFRGCDGSRCSTRCSSDANCIDGMVCTNGSCGKRPIGAVCSRDDQCVAPGICAQGRCCAQPCNKTCMACNLEGSFGSCQPVPKGGSDPGGGCRDDACNNGCDGGGSCRREREGTVCGAAKCTAATNFTVHVCTAQGACEESARPCPDGETCANGRCVPPAKKLPGEPCALASDCAAMACVDGRCCANACSGSCRTCTQKTEWRCADRPDDASCGAKQICKTGRCLPQCTTAETRCGTSCTDLAQDPQNCGSCGNTCASRLCDKGLCLPIPTCLKGQIRCNSICLDPTIDPKNCGGCNQGCSAPTPICSASKCVRSLPMTNPGAPPNEPPANPPMTPPGKPTPDAGAPDAR